MTPTRLFLPVALMALASACGVPPVHPEAGGGAGSGTGGPPAPVDRSTPVATPDRAKAPREEAPGGPTERTPEFAGLMAPMAPDPSGSGDTTGGTAVRTKRADPFHDAGFGKTLKAEGAAEASVSPGVAPTGGGMAGRAGGSPGVKAGFADDNREFGAYLDYLEKFKPEILLPLDVSGRMVIEATAGQGRPASFASLAFKDGRGTVLARRTATADGRALWFPTEDPAFGGAGVTLEATFAGETVKAAVNPQGKRTLTVNFGAEAKPAARVPVDVCFLLDTTGSMGDEIQRLKDTLLSVHAALAGLPEKPDLKLGMVLYRDRHDAYRTRTVPFTADVKAFATALAPVTADGGGDYPEDLQEGFRVVLTDLAWRDGAVKVMFILTDAPPHVYPDEPLTYLGAAREAAARGIKIVGIGASGLTSQGETVLRQVAEYTMGQFVFLTYGETGESEGGTATSVSHHTGDNFQTRNLDAIIVRFVRAELAALTGRTLAEDDWMEAGPPRAGENRDAVLGKLFDEGVRRLLDFSMAPVAPKTPVAVLPVDAPKDWTAAAERVESQLLLAVARHPAFALVERSKDLRQVLGEQALGLTGAVDEAGAAKVGKLVGAKLLVLSRLTPGEDRPDLLLKLVKAETAEVLAVSLLKPDATLLR